MPACTLQRPQGGIGFTRFLQRIRSGCKFRTQGPAPNLELCLFTWLHLQPLLQNFLCTPPCTSYSHLVCNPIQSSGGKTNTVGARDLDSDPAASEASGHFLPIPGLAMYGKDLYRMVSQTCQIRHSQTVFPLQLFKSNPAGPTYLIKLLWGVWWQPLGEKKVVKRSWAWDGDHSQKFSETALASEAATSLLIPRGAQGIVMLKGKKTRRRDGK